MKAAVALLAITLLSFFVFPGHTYLQQDTQVYVPILENQWSGALASDLIVARPHVNFTLYDELTGGVRWLTRAPLRFVLEGEQLGFRALGFLGVYLIALALGLETSSALVVTSIFALGATIGGSAVLTVEYEPTPRAFAVPLLLLAIGLVLRKQYWLAGVAGASAFLLHAPTTWPFLLSVLALAVYRPRAAWALIPLAVGACTLLIVGYTQPVTEAQHFFEPIPPQLEVLQRLRAPYNYVSTWWTEWMAQYSFFAAVALLGLWRIKATKEQWIVCGSLLGAGLGSVPLSFLLLEQQKWLVIPEVQPARALLLVTLMAVLAGTVAGCLAANRKRWVEGSLWFLFALWIPAQPHFFMWPKLRVLLVIVGFSLLLASLPAMARAGASLLLAFAMAIPAGVVTYRNIETPDLASLAGWARSETNKRAVFAFPEAGRDRSPGCFRSEALRAVYVDWKGGGQVNYLPDLGYDWWKRWQAVMEGSKPLRAYALLGIDFVVLREKRPDLPVAYGNKEYFVYRTSE